MDYSLLVWLWDLFVVECEERKLQPEFDLFNLWIEANAPHLSSWASDLWRKEVVAFA